MSILDMPDWVQEYVNTWADYLRLNEWRIRTRLALTVNHDADTAGCCIAQPNINTASITFRADIQEGKDDSDWERTIIHELLHVLHARMDDYVENTVIPQLPKATRKIARAGYDSENERYTDMLAKICWSVNRPNTRAESATTDQEEAHEAG